MNELLDPNRWTAKSTCEQHGGHRGRQSMEQSSEAHHARARPPTEAKSRLLLRRETTALPGKWAYHAIANVDTGG